MHTWKHAGFSVDKSVALAAGDTAGLERVAAYMIRCPFSLDRIISVSDDLSACGYAQAGGNVVYRVEKSDCRPFPALGDQKLRRRAARQGKSLNRFIVEMVEENIWGDVSGKPREHHDLDHLFGSLSEEDSRFIDEVTAESRTIDDEVWS